MNRPAILILFLSFIAVSIFGSTTGKVRGTIVDSETGEPLIGANIILKGTTLGAASNIDGVFIILLVPPGTYDVEASMR